MSLWFSPVSSTYKTDRHDKTLNIVESGVKHHQPTTKTNKREYKYRQLIFNECKEKKEIVRKRI